MTPPARVSVSPLSLFPRLRAATLLAVATSLAVAAPAPKKRAPVDPEAAPWVEADFPFFSSVLDVRRAGAPFPKDNLSPRALILNLGHDCWAAFDPDLLRVTAVWRGRGVTPLALAPGSYHDISRKTPGGQADLPAPDGTLWLATGLYAGAQPGENPSLADPRDPAPSPEELGRGPLPAAQGRFEAVQLAADGAVLAYTVAGTAVRERFSAREDLGRPAVLRTLEIGPSTQLLTFIVGRLAANFQVALAPLPAGTAADLKLENGNWLLRVPARSKPLALTLALTSAPGGTALTAVPALPAAPAPRRWAAEVATAVKLSAAPAAFVVDHFALPQTNPWRRKVRPADIQFLPDGTGVVPTLDGDVWLVRGLAAASGQVAWRRFASGLHEPMNVAIRDGEIFVFDKNGVWRLRDTDGNGEADRHELFSNVFGQTADMREFPSNLRLGPGGEFVIAKGGQQALEGKHNGSVLRLSADGRSATVLGYGFRQPNIAVHPRTGLVTSSDQQGQYIPSTPLHIVRDRQFYGFLGGTIPKEKYPAPIADPLTWIPHAVNASATSQVWLVGAKMGPLNDTLVHIGFNKPELFRVLLNDRGSRPQAAVVGITKAFEFPPLHGSVNPADGQLYLAGFQVLGWGNVLDVAGGLGRVRYTGAPVTIPREVVPMDQGVLLRFETALDRTKAADPASYSLQTWGYQRTYKYGSPQYKADGKPGQDSLTPSSAYVSQDGRSVFVGVPGMKPVQQLRIGWSLATAAGLAFDENAYTSPYELAKFDPRAEGFGDLAVDLTPRAAVAAAAAGPATAEEGRRLAQLFACVACHAEEFNPAIVRSGPPWKGLYGSERTVFIGGKSAKAKVDAAYLREAILEPGAKIAAGFEKGEYAMPSFAGVLNDTQVDSLVLYLRTLQ